MCSYCRTPTTLESEAWWYSSHKWSAAIDAYGFFRKDRPGWQGQSVVLYVREQWECTELCQEMSDETADSLWVRTGGHTSVGDIVVGVSYTLNDQEVDEVFFR